MSKYIIESVDIQLKQDIIDHVNHPSTDERFFCYFKKGQIINAELITLQNGSQVLMMNKKYALPYISKSAQMESPLYHILMTHGHMEDNGNEAN